MHDSTLAEQMRTGDVRALSTAHPGDRGVIVHVGDHSKHGVLGAEELERRLLELGFVEGADIELLHEGMIGGDPIAVRVDGMRVALRRKEAAAINVRFESGN
ncbi:FeoA family protein [Caulobacter segnis]|uniref:FeoA family protein n=1 Tax=Caulobacter segnis TaxID=88688 RepID=UPI00240FC933|nr:FeoA family protein [Caulobacter segnis]MDG2519971.1 FeoA family protein [Caulobacter segnis]